MCFLSPIPEKISIDNERVCKAFHVVDQALDLLSINLSKKSVYYEVVQRANKVVKNVLNEDASQMWLESWPGSLFRRSFENMSRGCSFIESTACFESTIGWDYTGAWSWASGLLSMEPIFGSIWWEVTLPSIGLGCFWPRG